MSEKCSMMTKLQSLAEDMGELVDLPDKVADRIDRLKASDGAQRCRNWTHGSEIISPESRRRSGLPRPFRLFWSVTSPGCRSTDGSKLRQSVRRQSPSFGLPDGAQYQLMQPQSASELVIDELEDRVRPLRWGFERAAGAHRVAKRAGERLLRTLGSGCRI